MKKMICMAAALWFMAAGLFAQRVDTVEVKSAAMNAAFKCVVVLPAGYDENVRERYPVVYLLHGHGGRYNSWIKLKPELPQIASQRGMIFVCPDAKNSWYWDSPVDPGSRFETYVAKEVPAYVDRKYRTKADPKGRAVAGLSMGGHGALWLAFRHPDVFGACGSMSGGVDIRPFPENWHMAQSLGSYYRNPKVWDKHTVMEQLYRVKPGSLAIIVDCGTEDFFYEVNQELHRRMLYRNIKHDFITRPGAHNSKYWKQAVVYQLLFFDDFFKGGKAL